MVIVHKEGIIDMSLMEALSELHQVSEKLRFFQDKYKQDFENYSLDIEKKEEDFKRFDDYMEWKAYTQLFRDIQQKIEDLKHGNFQVA